MNSELLMDLKTRLHEAKHAVFFGGAGMSTASGIPDFRGSQGLYTTSRESSPEYLLSVTCLRREPQRFFDYYRSAILYHDAAPNAAHRALAKLEKDGVLKALITQNIDGLHQAGGSRRVLELHGSVARAYCAKCGKEIDSDVIAEEKSVPRCPDCGGVVRPDVVLYGEYLPEDVFEDAVREIGEADFLLVGGSSLTVQPAASLVESFIRRDAGPLAILNKTPTDYDAWADFLVRDPVEEILPILAGE